MEDKTEDKGKRLFIEFKKLEGLIESLSTIDQSDFQSVDSAVSRFNEILRCCKEFLKDETAIFKSIENIDEIKHLERQTARSIYVFSEGSDWAKKISLNAVLVKKALESWSLWNLPIEKQRTIGFRSE